MAANITRFYVGFGPTAKIHSPRSVRSAPNARHFAASHSATKRANKRRASKPPTEATYFVPAAANQAEMSGASCCQRLIRPAITAPRMGASQNNQSCAM